jgi:hypothetical protein
MDDTGRTSDQDSGMEAHAALMELFEGLHNPRAARDKCHPLPALLGLAVVAMIAGMTTDSPNRPSRLGLLPLECSVSRRVGFSGDICDFSADAARASATRRQRDVKGSETEVPTSSRFAIRPEHEAEVAEWQTRRTQNPVG